MSSNPAVPADKTVECVDIDGNLHRVSVDELRWRPSAYAIVIKDNTLLVSPQFSGYDLPGGGLELGEMPEQAVVRECREETGIDVADPVIVGVASNLFMLPYSDKGACIHSILIYYACTMIGGELGMDGFDEYEKQYSRMPEWLPLTKLDDITVASSVDWRPYVRKVMDENSRH